MVHSLRTVSPFAIAHTFCASARKSSFYWRCLLKQRYFCAAYNFAGNADLGTGYWNPKRRVGRGKRAFSVSQPLFVYNSVGR